MMETCLGGGGGEMQKKSGIDGKFRGRLGIWFTLS